MNDLTLSKNSLKVLSVLISSIQEHNLHSLASVTGFSVMGISKIVRQLEKKQIITINKFGKSCLLRINKSWQNFLFFSLAEQYKRNDFLQKHPSLNGFILQLQEKLRTKAEFALIFGSYASGEESSVSDLDILIVSSEKKEVFKIIKNLSVLLNINLSPFVVTKAEFVSQARKKHRLYREIIDGKRIMITGEYEYWKLVLN